MRKSLVILMVIVASLALCGVAFAEVCGPTGCAPAVKAKDPKAGFKAVTTKEYVPKKFVPKGSKCVQVKPCPVTVNVPGEPFAKYEMTVWAPVKKVLPVYRELCKGKAKGECKPMGNCGPGIKWSANWITLEKLGERPVPVIDKVKKVVPIPASWPTPECGPARTACF
ncbi:MAG: hypothetical protein AB1646_03885 [Thermodesulfobacteriota bacterium]